MTDDDEAEGMMRAWAAKQLGVDPTSIVRFDGKLAECETCGHVAVELTAELANGEAVIMDTRGRFRPVPDEER